MRIRPPRSDARTPRSPRGIRSPDESPQHRFVALRPERGRCSGTTPSPEPARFPRYRPCGGGAARLDPLRSTRRRRGCPARGTCGRLESRFLRGSRRGSCRTRLPPATARLKAYGAREAHLSVALRPETKVWWGQARRDLALAL